VVRYDADVFGIMLPTANLVNATGVGHRLRNSIQQSPLRLREEIIQFTLSAGVAEVQPGEDLSALLARADEARMMASTDGGNCVRFHTGISVETSPEKEPALV